MNLKQRAKQNLSLSMYVKADQNLESCAMSLDAPKEQYILRMPIYTPTSNGWRIPTYLNWIYPALATAIYEQGKIGVAHPFVYVTVRSGIVRSTTDDVFHADGFSMRIPHVPEQNYIWSDVFGTESLQQNFEFPDDFDPLKHNIHQFFQDRASVAPVVLETGRLYQIDPYNVHRRPEVPKGTQRTFFRISFVPIEIEDDTCMQNPMMAPRAPYNRADIRDTLTRY